MFDILNNTFLFLEKHDVQVDRCFVGTYVTSMEMAGVSITVMILHHQDILRYFGKSCFRFFIENSPELFFYLFFAFFVLFCFLFVLFFSKLIHRNTPRNRVQSSLESKIPKQHFLWSKVSASDSKNRREFVKSKFLRSFYFAPVIRSR